MSTVRTGMLLAALTAIFVGVGFLIGGTGGALVAFAVAVAMNAYTYWNADRLVLSMTRAHEVDEKSAPEFYALVRRLAERAELPMPRVYMVDDPQPNAFATGRDPDHAAVAATTGLVSTLSREEITAVMAHELGHVRNRDTLIMTVAATIAGAIAMLANFAFFFGGFGRGRNSNPLGLIGILAAAIVAPLAALLVQMAISRTREYAADRAGAEICGDPQTLAAALAKISRAAGRTRSEAAERNPAIAHLFIVNPLSGERMDNLFATHPAPENRIAALMAMADGFPDARRSARVAVPSVGRTGPAASRRGPWG